MTHDEILSVVSAHKSGKRIEFKYKANPDATWVSSKHPSWNFDLYDYRIAREPRKLWIRWSTGLSDDTVWDAVSSNPIENSQLVTEQL